MSKLDYSDFNNKIQFPIELKDNKIYFPKLFSKINKSNKLRFWEIYGYLKVNNKIINLTNTNLDNYIDNIKHKTLVNNYIEEIIIITEYGLIDGKRTITEPTIINSGKNINKKNETNVLTQSMIYMRNLYLKKIKTGYHLKEDIKKENNNIFPMALQVYNKYKKYIKYPCFIQPKLDGIRVIAKLIKDGNEYKVELLSRRLNIYSGFEHIKDEIYKILIKYPNTILDGELYNHKLNLQDISGLVRNENIDSEKLKKDRLQLSFYIFDCILLNDNSQKMIFDERIKLLQELLLEKSNNTEKFKYLKLVDTTLVHSESESNELFKSYIKNKYEGIVYKNRNAIYEYSNIKEIRSHDYLKRKKNYEQEYPIIGFEEGSHGKDKGAIIFTMKTDNNKEFRAVPNMTLNKRKELYKIALKSFDTKFKNKLPTISFDEFSKDNVPLRPKFITIRDYE
jgi:DNA ligase-1